MQLRVPDLVTSANQQIELVCQSSKFFSLGRFFVCSAQIFFLELLKTLLPRFSFLIMQYIISSVTTIITSRNPMYPRLILI